MEDTGRVKLDIYGGLLGTGKTTLIKQMLATAYKGYKVAIIENEIGKVNLDEEAFENPSIEVKPITSGCVCCTVKGTFTAAVEMLINQEHPDYIIVEPSGVADFYTVGDACTQVEAVELNRAILVVNGKKLLKLFKVAGEFLRTQIESARTAYINFSETMTEEMVEETKEKLWEINKDLHIIAVPMSEVDGVVIPDGLGDLGQAHKRMQVRGGRGNETKSWSFQFQKPLDDEMKAKLDWLFSAEENLGLWRGKGYFDRPDGSIMKLDYVYGDVYTETVADFPEEKRNILILIGTSRMMKKSLDICKEL